VLLPEEGSYAGKTPLNLDRRTLINGQSSRRSSTCKLPDIISGFQVLFRTSLRIFDQGCFGDSNTVDIPDSRYKFFTSHQLQLRIMCRVLLLLASVALSLPLASCFGCRRVRGSNLLRCPALPSPTHSFDRARERRQRALGILTSAGLAFVAAARVSADTLDVVVEAAIVPAEETAPIDFAGFKLPYNHENLPLKDFLGKATVVFNV
jgi:hypothetical protein